MARALKKRASKLSYQSTGQLYLEGFETPFSQKLSANNRWVQLSNQIPWDSIVNVYTKQLNNKTTGAGNVNGRVVLGALMIKHMCNLSDEETILQIQENMYMQYFLGYSSYSNDAPFDSSLFVQIRKRLGVEELNAINERIYELSLKNNATTNENEDSTKGNDVMGLTETTSKQQEEEITTVAISENEVEENGEPLTHKGRIILDATACPQDIAYPTDLKILNDCREKTEELIDLVYYSELHGTLKPRTYRENARKAYLYVAQRRKRTEQLIRKGVGKQLRYVRRNIRILNILLGGYERCPLKPRELKYLMVVNEVYRQQELMFRKRIHKVEDRIVSIHQPHVRPIVRGKEKAKVEFGSKLNLSLVDGYSFIDHLSWDAYNEGTLLIESVNLYRERHGYLPKEILADQIYCNRENRSSLKTLGIRLIAKPLGRPPAVKLEHLRPGERNPIEGKFGQAKTRYGMDRIKARLRETSESWIASIVLVLNLVKLAGQAPYWLIRNLMVRLIENYIILRNQLLFQ
ncbi:MAG TPA: IS5 family transposase [Daejeonella sp.]|nr:IS5 family transposase [Daejeonella sp.]